MTALNIGLVKKEYFKHQIIYFKNIFIYWTKLYLSFGYGKKNCSVYKLVKVISVKKLFINKTALKDKF